MSNRGRHRKSNQHLIVQILGFGIANRMMECQREQGNIPNLDVFLRKPGADRYEKEFTWSSTEEGYWYWHNILIDTFEEHSLYKRYKNDRR